MKGQDLYSRMSNFGISPETGQVVDWIDTWQKDIATEAGKIVRYTFLGATANTEVALPTDFASLVELRYNGSIYKKSHSVRIDEEGYITFPEELTEAIVMRYRRVPADYKNLDTDLEPHALLQPIAIYYLMSLYYDKEGEGDEESAMAARWMSMYEAKKYEVLSKMKNPLGMEPIITEDVMHKLSRYHHQTSAYFEEGDADV